MNNKNEHDKQWYFTTFIKAVRFFLLLVMIGIIALVLFSCKNETIKKDGKTYEVQAHCINGYYQPLWNGKFYNLIWICTEFKTDTVLIGNYDKPIVADTVKHDWVRNENICIEKRLVYEQMINDIDR